VHVARDEADAVALLLSLHVALDQGVDLRAAHHADVLRTLDLRTGHGDDLRHVDAAFVEQAADDGQILDVDRPHHFALVHRVHVVDLHADVADGVFARKGVEFGALERGHLPFGLGAHREMHLARSEFAHHVDTRLEVLLFGFQHEIVIRGQRRGVEGGDEDRFRRVAGVGDDAVRALHDHRPKARPEQQGDDLLARSRPEVGLLKLLVLLGGVGSHRHGEDLALLSAVDGGREEHAFVVLVEEQRRAGFHPIALLNQQLGSHALEIEGREGILRSLRRVRERLLGFAHQIDV